jgi:hypothetical protein
MKAFTTSLALAALFTSTIAQYTIDPSSVSNGTKDGWCTSQTGSPHLPHAFTHHQS